MDVREKTRELAKEIKESSEYKEYKEVRDFVYNDLRLKDKVDEFEKIRYEEQLLTIQGEKQDEEKMQKLQELYAILVKEPEVKNFFDKQVKFNVMIADVNKIIGEAIKDVL